MLTIILIYFVLTFGTVAALSAMILHIGKLMATCPDLQLRTRAVTVTVATGFAATGAGGSILIGALIPVLEGSTLTALCLASGLSALCLGLGFTHAVTTVRALLTDPAATPAPAQ